MSLDHSLPRARRFAGSTIIGSPKHAITPPRDTVSDHEAALVEAYAQADAAAKAADAMKTAARQALLAYAANARTRLRAPAFLVTITEQARTSLDTTRIKAEMPSDWIADRSTTTLAQIVKVTAL